MYEFVGLLGFRVRLLEINQVLESIRQAFHHQLPSATNPQLHAFWNMELGRQLRMRLVSNKSYPTVQTTLNNEQDWRNGLRVKLLEHARKFARRILTMKEVDPEKDNTGRVHGQTKGEENKNSNEHHHHRHHHPDTSVDILFKIIYHGPNSCSSSRRLPLRLEASDTIFTFDMLKSFVTVA
ncbi:unnamed protein product [Brassica oleracea]